MALSRLNLESDPAGMGPDKGNCTANPTFQKVTMPRPRPHVHRRVRGGDGWLKWKVGRGQVAPSKVEGVREFQVHKTPLSRRK